MTTEKGGPGAGTTPQMTLREPCHQNPSPLQKGASLTVRARRRRTITQIDISQMSMNQGRPMTEMITIRTGTLTMIGMMKATTAMESMTVYPFSCSHPFRPPYTHSPLTSSQTIPIPTIITRPGLSRGSTNNFVPLTGSQRCPECTLVPITSINLFFR